MINKKIAIFILILLFLNIFYFIYREGPLNIVSLSGNYIGVDNSENPTEYAKQFLLTKSTGSMGCGPPDDFDCSNNRYSGYMAIANMRAYQQIKDKKFLEYAIKFAMTKQTNTPDWCPNCICNPPDDFNCGSGEVQAEMIQVFAKLYDITKERKYLEYAEDFVNTKPSELPESCKDCSCGPPDDFDCGERYVQSNYLRGYKLMYKATNDVKYLDYIKELGDAWIDKTIEQKGPHLIRLYKEIYELTKNKKYLDHTLKLGSEIIKNSCNDIELRFDEQKPYSFDQPAYILNLAQLYELTKNNNYLECAERIILNSNQCNDGVCKTIVQQASMIIAYVELYSTSDSQKYLELAEELAKQENIESVETNIFGYTTTCNEFDCGDAEDNAFMASALLKLAEAKNGSIQK